MRTAAAQKSATKRLSEKIIQIKNLLIKANTQNKKITFQCLLKKNLNHAATLLLVYDYILNLKNLNKKINNKENLTMPIQVHMPRPKS